jgi:hypothetical protein
MREQIPLHLPAGLGSDLAGIVDQVYNSRANRELLRRRGISHTIPEPSDQQANGPDEAAPVADWSGSTRPDTSGVTSSNAASASSNTGAG